MTIDNLEIGIIASSKDATQSIGRLISALIRLQGVMGGFKTNTLSKEIARIARAAKGNAGSSKGIRQLSQDLENMNKAVDGSKASKASKAMKSSLDDIVQSTGGVEKTTESMKNLNEQVENIAKTTKQGKGIPDWIQKSREYFEAPLDKPIQVKTKQAPQLTELEQMQKQADDLQRHVEHLQYGAERARAMTENGISASAMDKLTANVNSPQLSQMAAQASMASDKENLLTRATLEASDAFSKLKGVASSVGDGLKSVGSNAVSAASAVAKFAFVRPFQNFANSVSQARTSLDKFMASLKRIAVYRMIRAFLKQVSKAFTEGVKNVSLYSQALGNMDAGHANQTMSQLASTSLQLQNSIGAAVIPVLNAVAPLFIWLANAVMTAVNAINQLFAILGGQTMWTRAKSAAVDYADAVGGAGKANKDFSKTIGIDELNVLDPNQGGGGGGGGGINPADMFEEVALETAKFADWLEPFKKAWDNVGEKTIAKIKRALESVKTLFGDIGKSFKEVWTNGTGQETVETLLEIVGNLADMVGNLADGWDRAWTNAGTGTQIIQNIWNAFNEVLHLFEGITALTAQWLGQLDWSPLFESIATLTAEFQPLIQVINEGLLWAYENVLLPFGTWTIEEALPAVVNLLASAFGLLTSILSQLLPLVQPLWDNFLAPLRDFAWDVIIQKINLVTSTFRNLTDFINGNISFTEFCSREFQAIMDYCSNVVDSLTDVLDKFAEFIPGLDTVSQAIDMFWEEHFLPTIDAIVKIVEDLWNNTLEPFWNQHLKPLIDDIRRTVDNVLTFIGIKVSWLQDNPLAQFLTFFGLIFSATIIKQVELMAESVDTKIKFISGLIDAFRQTLDGLNKFVSGVFALDWGKAWDGIKDMACGAVNAVISAVEFLINSTIDGLNALLAPLDMLSDVAQEAGIDLPDAHFDHVSLGRVGTYVGDGKSGGSGRHFAEGGFPTQGELFMANEDGAEYIGSMNGRTAVANNDQIVAGIAGGVAVANSPVVSAIYQLIGVVEDKDLSVSIGDNEIGRSYDRYNMNRGVRVSSGAFANAY